MAIGGSTLVFVFLGVGKHNESTLMGAASLLGIGVIGWNISLIAPTAAESRSSFAGRCRAVAIVMTVVCVSAGVLIAPARWSAAAVAHPQTRTGPASSLDGVAPPTEEESIISANDRAIVAFVERRSVGDSPILATSRVGVAAEIATGSTHVVAALGGFFGSGLSPAPGDLTYVGVVVWCPHAGTTGSSKASFGAGTTTRQFARRFLSMTAKTSSLRRNDDNSEPFWLPGSGRKPELGKNFPSSLLQFCRPLSQCETAACAQCIS